VEGGRGVDCDHSVHCGHGVDDDSGVCLFACLLVCLGMFVVLLVCLLGWLLGMLVWLLGGWGVDLVVGFGCWFDVWLSVGCKFVGGFVGLVGVFVGLLLWWPCWLVA
jgi:hypothetical protein